MFRYTVSLASGQQCATGQNKDQANIFHHTPPECPSGQTLSLAVHRKDFDGADQAIPERSSEE